jgi:iron(III) transport system ATP-binding protein
MITIANLKLAYHSGPVSVPVLKGIDLDIKRGEFLTLLGPSGCGKTTLLRAIAGLETPDAGRIAIDGTNVFEAEAGTDLAPARRDIGMVFQSYAIWPHMSVFENAAFPLRYRARQMNRAAVRTRTMECLELVRLGHLADRPAPMLSGGQQQRLALARALCADPKVLLLDEPLSNLDARLREDMRFELREITRKSGVTTVFVTHEQSEALSMSDRVVVLNEGRVMQSGSPRDLYLSPDNEFVATFLGRSNLVPGQVTAVDGSLQPMITVSSTLGTLRCRLHGAAAVGDSVTVVVRPNAIQLAAKVDTAEHEPVARIEGVAFLGDTLECALALADRTLIARVPSDVAPRLGAEVGIRVKPNDALALGRDNEERPGRTP